MPNVLNKRSDPIPPGAVYIGRARGQRGKWGNLFVISKDGTREEVIARYERWLCDSPEAAPLREQINAAAVPRRCAAAAGERCGDVIESERTARPGRDREP